MDKRKPFEIIFTREFEAFVDSVERLGLGSIMLNLQGFGLSGNSKSGLDASDVVDHILDRQYAPFYFFVKRGRNWSILYLWGGESGSFDEREAGRKEMQSNSEWFFILLREVIGKGTLVDVGEKMGRSLYHVSRVSDIPEKIKQYTENPNSAYHTKGGGVFIRVRVTSSRINLFEVYKEYWPRVREYLNELKIDYKVINL